MAEEITLLRDLALVLVTAAAVSLLFQRLRQPVVLGYLVAGLILGEELGPFPLIGDAANIAVLAQLGIVFLLFSLGLEFHLPKLKRVGGFAVTSAVLETALLIGMGMLVARLFGWDTMDAIFLGAILAMSSTVLIVKVHNDLGLRRAPTTQAIFGIMLVEDIIAIVLLALLSSIALTGVFEAGAIMSVVLRVAIFIVATLVLGHLLVPRLIDRIARKGSEESLIITSLGVLFAMALVAVLLGLSVALAAFIAGAIIAESRASNMVERRVGPLRDVFTAVFFVSIGILIDPADFVTYAAPILILSVVTILGNFGAISLATFIAGFPPHQALRVGLGMAMIGEFSFIIAALGRDLGVTADFLLPIAVGISIITAFVTPILIKRADTVVAVVAWATPEAVKDYARMYTAWVGRRRAIGSGAYMGGFAPRTAIRVVAYALLTLAILLGAGLVDEFFFEVTGETVFVAGDVVVAYWAVVVLLALPVVVGLARAIKEFVHHLADVVIPPEQARGARGTAASAVLRNTLYAFFAVLTATIVFAAGSTFLPPLPLMVAAAILVLAAGSVLWGSVKRLNAQIDTAVETVFSADTPTATKDKVLALIREQHPWDTSLESVLIPLGSRAAHRRIRDLGLPQRTGAAIVTHERDGAYVVNPPADLLLLPGDMVGLFGDEDQVNAAKSFLVAEAEAVSRPVEGSREVHVEELVVEASSPLAGVTLAGSRIRERTGASVVGLRRQGKPILNPAPVTRLQPGDAIVVLGTPEQVAAARALLARAEE